MAGIAQRSVGLARCSVAAGSASDGLNQGLALGGHGLVLATRKLPFEVYPNWP